MSAGGIIYDSINDKLLVVQGCEKLSFPKGHKKSGEVTHDTAMREIFEETSIKLQLTQFNCSKKIAGCVYFFIILDNGEQFTLSPIDTKEVIAIKWVTRQQLLESISQCNRQLRLFIEKWDHMMFYIDKNRTKLHLFFISPIRLIQSIVDELLIKIEDDGKVQWDLMAELASQIEGDMVPLYKKMCYDIDGTNEETYKIRVNLENIKDHCIQKTMYNLMEE
jgi:ADP-ribose pyrophosphatase YjhB (NUDIX family)